MATLTQHIYAVKNILNNGIASDDATLSNSLIAHFLQMSRALLVKQKMDKYRYLSELNYISVCMPLEVGEFAECANCIPENVNCKLLKGKCKLPKEVVAHRSTTIQVKRIDGSIIPQTSITRNNLSKYSLTQKDPDLGWFLENGYLYVLNKHDLPLVIIKGIWENPADLDNFCGCGTSTEQGPCYDSSSGEFPIDAELVMPMYQMTLEFLRSAIATPRDEENDASGTRIFGYQGKD